MDSPHIGLPLGSAKHPVQFDIRSLPAVFVNFDKAIDCMNTGVQVRADPLDRLVDVRVLPTKIMSMKDPLMVHDPVAEAANTIEAPVDIWKIYPGSIGERLIDEAESLPAPDIRNVGTTEHDHPESESQLRNKLAWGDRHTEVP